jgi:YggT family protein
MNIFGVIVYDALQFFILLMWIRLIVDFVRSARPGWRPARVLLVILSVVYAITDPPVKLVRRVVRPVRFGQVSIDFAWTIVLLAAIILSNVIGTFARA